MKQWKTGPALVKFLAIFSVVGVHFMLNTMDPVVITGTWPETLYFGYRQLFIICVPLFMLATGYLNLRQEPSMKYFRKLLPILGIYLFYSVLALFFRQWWLGEQFTTIQVWHQIFNFKAIPYAWYVKMFIGLFLLTPFVNKLIQQLARQELDLFLGVLSLLTILPLTFNFFTAALLQDSGTLLPDFWTGLYPVTYYVAGARLRLYPLKLGRGVVAAMGLSAAVLSVVLSVLLSHDGELSRAMGDYGNLFIFIQSIAVFSLLVDCQVDRLSESRLLQFVARHTLHIYLASYISDQIVYGLLGEHLLTQTYTDFRYSLLFVVLSFALAALIVYVAQTAKLLLTALLRKPDPETTAEA